MAGEARGLLRSWLERQAAPEALAWLDEQVARLAGGAPDKALFLAFSLAGRKLGKDDLVLDEDDLARARAARAGWDPRGATLVVAGRTVLLLAWPASDPAAYGASLDRLFRAADLGELVALYRALPLLPHPEAHRARAAEGLRSNIRAVFEAVAHRSPYPAEHLDEGAWNQMVLKALFTGAPLWRIEGIERRANPRLRDMLLDYADERWAAGRAVSPELWRPVGPCADDRALTYLDRVLRDGSLVERQAAARALGAAESDDARALLAAHPALQGPLPAWEDIARAQMER